MNGDEDHLKLREDANSQAGRVAALAFVIGGIVSCSGILILADFTLLQGLGFTVCASGAGGMGWAFGYRAARRARKQVNR